MEKLKRHISRIKTFDLLRGYFMVSIVIDHLAFFPNGIDWWSARGGLFVTAAEGFFLISGIVLGVVRGAKLIDQPMAHVSKLLLKRGLQLYLTSITLVLLFTVVGWLFYMGNPGLKPEIAAPNSNIFSVLWSTLTLQYYYGWTDYLRLYALFLFVSPLAFWLLRRGLWYVVLGLSLVVWSLYPNDLSLPFNLRVYLQPLSWQSLFFIGVVTGFYWNHIVDSWRNLPHRYRQALTVGLLSLAGVTFTLNVLIMLSTMGVNTGPVLTPELQHYLFDNYFNKEAMPLGRILLALTWFWAAFYLFKRFEVYVTAVLGWLLIPFGTNSLYVYTLHAFIVFFIDLYFVPGPLWFNFLVTAGSILLIRLAVKYRLLMGFIPR